MISALIFMAFNGVSYWLSLTRGPFWGLFAYMNIYFNAPLGFLNWWTSYLPFSRWSLLTSAVLLISLVLHKDKRTKHNFASGIWMLVFLVLSAFIAMTSAMNKQDAYHFLYLLFTYCLITYIIVRSVRDLGELRLFLLAIVLFTAYLSLDAYLNGERVNARLEGSGSADANQSNEFALLLVSVSPFIFSFILYGTRWEKILCFLSLPFVLNAFILCNSRGSAVAFVGAAVLAFVFVADRKMRRGLLMLGVAALPLVIYLADEAYVDRISSLLGISGAMKYESQANTLSSGRTKIWEYGMAMAEDHPFGAGPNSFKTLARFYMPDEILTYHPRAEYGVRSAHNTYLQVMVEQGFLGLIIWLIMCIHTCIIQYKSYKMFALLPIEVHLWKVLALALSISFICTLLGGLVNSRIYYEFFWWQIAISIVMYSLAKHMTLKQSEEH